MSIFGNTELLPEWGVIMLQNRRRATLCGAVRGSSFGKEIFLISVHLIVNVNQSINKD